MKVYNVALIGCGQMRAAHLDDIYYKDIVKITCVCELDIEKAQLFARKYNVGGIEMDY